MVERLTELGVLTPSVFHANVGMSEVHQRMLAATDAQELDLQLKTETLAALHQIRRILVWTLIAVPLLLLGLGVVLLVALAS